MKEIRFKHDAADPSECLGVDIKVIKDIGGKIIDILRDGYTKSGKYTKRSEIIEDIYNVVRGNGEDGVLAIITVALASEEALLSNPIHTMIEEFKHTMGV